MLDEIIKALQNDGIVVIRTDTIYGIIARAASKEAVERVYAAKKRETDKQCIVLIASPSDVAAYGTVIEQYSKNEKMPTSVVVPVSNEPDWVLRGGSDVAYRLVKNELLRQIIQEVGPVIAPSANPEGQPPARNITEAKRYFGELVDLYVDGKEVPRTAHPSQIVRINKDGTVEHLR